jgi:hypothetical protein
LKQLTSEACLELILDSSATSKNKAFFLIKINYGVVDEVKNVTGSTASVLSRVRVCMKLSGKGWVFNGALELYSGMKPRDVSTEQGSSNEMKSIC